MTFKNLQDELIVVPSARFKETQRASVKYWLNFAYAKMWNLDDWTFRQATGSVAVTANTQAGAAPADLSSALALYRDDGSVVNYLQPRKFLDAYQAKTYTGLVEDFTIIGSSVLVGPLPSGSATFTLLYEKAFTALVNDNDVPAVPAEYHYALVYGASVLGLVNENDFTWQFASQLWQESLASMQQNYLSNQRGQSVQWGSWDDFSTLDSWSS